MRRCSISASDNCGGFRARPRPACRDPVQHLDALRAGQPHDLVDRVPGQRLGIGSEVVEAEQVVFRVHEAGARAVELVREATGADHHDPLIPLPCGQRPVHRPAQRKTAFGRGQRVLHRIDADRHQLHRPFPDPRIGQLERDRDRVIDQHLLADGGVELVGHHLFNDVPRQRRMTRETLVQR